MKVMTPARSRIDRVVGGLLLSLSLVAGLLIAGLNSGGFTSPDVLVLALPLAAPGVVTGVGISLTRKWGFWVAIVLSLFWLFPLPLTLICEGADYSGAVVRALPAMAMLIFCEFRLRGRLGPVPN